MKKIATLFTTVFIISVLVLAGCGGATNDDVPTPSKAVEITTTVTDLEIGKYDVADKNYTSYFAIKDNGVSLAVRKEYVDASAVLPVPGEYFVICRYKNEQASIKVTVRRPEITLTAKTERVTLKKRQVDGYDYAAHFTLIEDGHEIALPSECVHSGVKAEEGDYEVTATFDGVSATLKVRVERPIYELTASPAEIELTDRETEGYDYAAHFTMVEDGEQITVTADMLEGEVLPVKGVYVLTLKAGFYSAKLTVKVVHIEDVEAYACYKSYDLTKEQAETFDFTRLFTLFVQGKAQPVTESMLDLSALENASEGDECAVVFSFTHGDVTVEKSVLVRIVAPPEVRITAKNVETYPNSGVIDLKSLFTLYIGDEIVPVTANMIEGSVDYSKVGENAITLSYGGKSATAIVTVRMGVAVQSPGVVKIKKGTNKQTYDFIGDFAVRVNGVSFSLIPEEYFTGLEEVDFNVPGRYEVTLSVPYCTTPPDVWSNTVKFDYAEYTLVYEVVERFYTVERINSVVNLPEGTTEYNVFSNVSVHINGIKQTLTERADWVDAITCYARSESEIDFSFAGEQRVRVAVYPDGAENQPVYVEYTVVVASSVKIYAFDRVVFTGATLRAEDLFEITDRDKTVESDYNMIEGKADVFAPGVYVLTLTYKNVSCECRVAVIDRTVQGGYFTGIMRTADNEYDDNYYEGEEDWGVEEDQPSIAPGDRADNMIVDEKGGITVDGRKATMKSAISESHLLIGLGTFDYDLFYEDGVVALVPVNTHKISFTNELRPLVYFSSDKYEYEDTLIVNSSSDHVIKMTYPAYTLEIFKLKNKASGEKICFGLKTELVERTSFDSYYEVSWGKVELSLSGEAVGASGNAVFDGKKYSFTMVDVKTAKIDKADAVKQYAGMTFTGVVDGKTAVLSADSYENFEYLVGGKTVASMGNYDIVQLKGSGADYDLKTVFLLGNGDNKQSPFSYKFSVNPEDKTFKLLPRDRYFGRYDSDNAYVFLDGYGTGYISFNKKYYSKTRLKYEVGAGEVTLTYLDTEPSFAYGTGASLIFDAFGNVLTPLAFEGIDFADKTFENSFITDGAIVRAKSFVMGAEPSLSAEAKFFEGIEIITKDGVLSEAEKRKCVDVSTISFTTPGFYRYTITASLNGQPTVATYALQILENKYEGNALATALGKGALTGYFLSLDRFGRITLDCGGMTFVGLATIDGNAIKATARSLDGGKIIIEATAVRDGLVKATTFGTVVIEDYFTAGDTAVIGGKNFVLRAVTALGKTTYFLSGEKTLIGNEAEVTLIEGKAVTENGAIVCVTANGKQTFVRLDKWGDVEKGVIFAGSERGEYAIEQGSLVLDGFGNATLLQQKYAYIVSGDKAALSDDKNVAVAVVKLNFADKAAERIDYRTDNTLVEGKTYTASYTFVYENEAYLASTAIKFGANGKAIISSQSSDFEEGEYASVYKPDFVGEASYSVQNGVITITAGKYTFTLNVRNVLTPVSLELIGTTQSENSQGYMSIGTLFNV